MEHRSHSTQIHIVVIDMMVTGTQVTIRRPDQGAEATHTQVRMLHHFQHWFGNELPVQATVRLAGLSGFRHMHGTDDLLEVRIAFEGFTVHFQLSILHCPGVMVTDTTAQVTDQITVLQAGHELKPVLPLYRIQLIDADISNAFCCLCSSRRDAGTDILLHFLGEIKAEIHNAILRHFLA